MVSNLKGGRHGHLALFMTAEDYMEQTGFAFLPPHNPVDYPRVMGSAQEQALGTENFRTKPSSVSQVHLRGRRFEESDCHGGGTSLPVPTGGLVDRFWTSNGTHHATAYFLKLRGDQRDQNRGESSQDDGSLRPHGTPCPTD